MKRKSSRRGEKEEEGREKEKVEWMKKTGNTDARKGTDRGVQPPSTRLPIHMHIKGRKCAFLHFSTSPLQMDGRTGRLTDGQTDEQSILLSRD